MIKQSTVNKVLSIFTLLILLSTVLFSYKQFEDYKEAELEYVAIEKSMTTQMDTFIKGILKENIRKAELHLSKNTVDIQDMLLKEYGDDLQGFEEDINNPSADSSLSKILDEVLMNVYINKNTKDNKPFVASMEKVLWNRYMNIPSEHLLWDKFKDIHYNTILASKAIQALQDMNTKKYDFIFWEYTPTTIKNHDRIEDMDINKLLEVFHKEGLESLKSYEILVPIYITNDGDIFGTNDLNSLGEKIKNYKIMVVQRINIYDILDYYKSDLTFYESEIKKIELEVLDNSKNKASSIVEAIIFIICTMIGSAYVQNRLNSK